MNKFDFKLPDIGEGVMEGEIVQWLVAPGDVVDRDQALATNSSVLGRELNVLRAPEAGIVIGMTTQPAVVPGNPVCHIAIPDRGVDWIREELRGQSRKTLHARLRRQLASGVLVSRPEQ